ncbi:E3 ubiquitin-protein ligase NHLRC1-like [Mustelus asterias]
MCSAEAERQPLSLLRDIELNVLECKVCFERFGSSPARRPCALPCGHAVCRHCASALCRRRGQQAQEAAAAAQLECPFCRRSGPLSQAADCLPLLQLAELLSGAGGGPSAAAPPPPPAGGGGGDRRPELSAIFGGWGRLLNPRGLAVCGRSGAVAVVQDGEQPLGLFERGGRPLPGPGREQPLRYPLDVALAGGGQLLLVTDAGDSSLKVFGWRAAAGGRPELQLSHGGFGLPWGLASASADGAVLLLTDWARGSLLRLTLRLPDGGALLRRESLSERLCRPREVAVCPLHGSIHVVEHLAPGPGRRLSTFDSRGQLLRRMDGLGPGPSLPAGLSAIAVDSQGNVLLADGDRGAVLCVGTVDKADRRTIIESGLVRPVALACTGDGSLIVLDAGDHTWKVYTSPQQEPTVLG